MVKEYEEKILEYIKAKETKKEPVTLLELIEYRKQLKTSANTIKRNLRNLCINGKLGLYIKMSAEKGFVLPKADELFFTMINGYKYPQDVKKLIDAMCQSNTALAMQALEEFTKLCDERNVVDGKKLGFALMSGIIPNLKEKVTFELTVNVDWSGTIGGYNPKSKKWEGGIRNYEYFTSD